MLRCGYIVKYETLEMVKHSTSLQSEGFSLLVSGVSNGQQAVLSAQEMLTYQVQMIELSGDFTEEEVEAVRAGINRHVPVGVVQYEQKNV